MNELRMYYERLLCEAFDCKKRKEYYFADADYYDAVVKNPKETCAFMICALINMKKKTGRTEEIDSYIEKLSEKLLNNSKNLIETMDKILNELCEKRIIL